MEEKFENNAMEKVENIAGKYQNQNGFNKDEVDARQRKFEENQRRQELKEQRFYAKKNMREERLRFKDKTKGKRGGNGGWITAVVSLGVCTLVLASVLTFTFLMPTKSDKTLESEYKKSFYDTTEQVDNMDLNMSKILASKDGGAIQLYLTDLAINSELAERDLQTLPLKDENKFYTTKLVNQIGDFAKYLNKKLVNGEDLSEEDRETLTALFYANAKLKEMLFGTMSEMDNDFSFLDMDKTDASSIVIDNFNELENLSVEYPELIYDGPFSDGLDEREIKGLSKETVDKNGAREVFISIFNDYGLQDINDDGMLDGEMKCYNFSASVKGVPLYAQISERGGKLVMFSYAGSCGETLVSEEDVIRACKAFLEKNGIFNAQAVWINLSNNVYTVNFVTEINGTVIYPDMVKIRVCAETGTVIGFEGTAYYINHTERSVGAPAISKETAREKVSSDMEIDSVRLAVVPVGVKSEKLCYEFSGVIDGATYYVYIDAVSGRQVEMFKVVESTEGKLLM